MLRKDDGEADFSLSARLFEGRVRGFDPWPGVWARKGGRRLRIVRARAREGEARDGLPGSVLSFDGDAFLVGCGGRTVLAVHAVQPEGRNVISALDALHGRVMAPGDRLEGTPASS
jgi:methionyl-tRNA formyltransferase